MSEYGQKLYKELMNLLVTNPDSFKFKDYKAEDGAVFRIFNYDIPKYTEFQQPGAMDCRGTMYYVKDDVATLVALPMKKFFSLGETPETSKINKEEAKYAYLKEDGSLLTSYISPVDNKLYFKSKNMPTYKESELVEKSISNDLLQDIERLTRDGYSVDLELTTPKNRVFIEYQDYKVHVLKSRNINTGEYLDIRSEEFAKKYPVVAQHLVKRIPIQDLNVEDKSIEGYVVEMDDNHSMYKVKTIPYLKMSAVVNIQDRSKERQTIYEATLYEILDEIRSLYHYRTHSPNFPLQEILTRIDEVEDYARKSYRYLVQTVDKFMEENKGLERGDFARKAKEEVPVLMPVLMELYLGRPIDYKQAAIKVFSKGNIAIPEIKVESAKSFLEKKSNDSLDVAKPKNKMKP